MFTINQSQLLFFEIWMTQISIKNTREQFCDLLPNRKSFRMNLKKISVDLNAHRNLFLYTIGGTSLYVLGRGSGENRVLYSNYKLKIKQFFC